MVALSSTRCLRQVKGERKGAAVEISHRFKVIEISSTARVSCVAALLRKQQSILQIQHKLIFRGVAQFGRALRSGAYTERLV